MSHLKKDFGVPGFERVEFQNDDGKIEYKALCLKCGSVLRNAAQQRLQIHL
jgi:hypothetical protein